MPFPTSTSRRAHPTRIAAILVTSLTLAACESESAGPTGPSPDPSLNVIATTPALNATSTDTLVRFSFATGAVVQGSSDWDIGLRRYEIRLNGGVSGSKGVVGYSMDNNKAATKEQVLGFTVASTLAAFDSVRTAQIPPDTAFKGDRLYENPTGYLNLAGVPSANASAYWKIKLANGSFGLVRVTAMTLSPSYALTSVTIESRLQTGATLAAMQSVAVPVAGATVSVSLGGNQAVAPAGCNWDLAINPQTFGMTVNTGCGAGTYPGPSSPAFAAATAANDAPEYGAYLAGLTGPVPNSITNPSAPFRYNLAGDNRLSPTFNTYLVKAGTRVYKLQVINYYSAAGASGYPTLRYALIK